MFLTVQGGNYSLGTIKTAFGKGSAEVGLCTVGNVQANFPGKEVKYMRTIIRYISPKG